MSDEQSVIITDLLKACGRKKMSLESTFRNTKSTKNYETLSAFYRFFWCLHFKKVKADSCATFVINLRKEVQNRALEQQI